MVPLPNGRRVAPAGMLRYFPPSPRLRRTSHFVSVPGFTGLVHCTGPFLLAGIAHYAVRIVWAMPVRTLTDGYGLLRTIGTRHSVCHVLSKFRSAWLSCFLCPVRSVPFSSVQFRSVPFSLAHTLCFALLEAREGAARQPTSSERHVCRPHPVCRQPYGPVAGVICRAF